MIEEINTFARTYPWLFSLISLVAGLVIGARLNYWNALELARRKEFNDVVERVRPVLEKELIELNPFSKTPEASDLNLLKHKLRRREREGYSKAVLDYKKARSSDTRIIPDTTAFEYSDEKIIVAAINDLLTHLEYR